MSSAFKLHISEAKIRTTVLQMYNEPFQHCHIFQVSESSEDASLEIVVPQFSFLPIRRQHEFNVGKDQTSVCIQIYGTQEGASDQEASLLAQVEQNTNCSLHLLKGLGTALVLSWGHKNTAATDLQ